MPPPFLWWVASRCPGHLIDEFGFIKSWNKKLHVREGDRGDEWAGERYINAHMTTFLELTPLVMQHIGSTAGQGLD